MRLQLESATDVFNLDDVLMKGEGVQATTGVSGLGLPAVSVQWLEGAGDGALFRGQRVLPRDIDLPLYLSADDRAGLQKLVSRLALMLSGPCILRLVEDDGSSWYTEVRRVGGGNYVYGEDTTGERDMVLVLTLRAGDPFWTYSQPSRKVIENSGSGRGLLNGLTKLQVSSSQAIGSITLENFGDAPAFPVWEINGPGDNFRAVSANGQEFKWAGTLAADEKLVIDTRAGTVKDGTGANRYGEMAPAPKLWSIPPGTTTALAELQNTSAGSLQALGNPIWTNLATNPHFEDAPTTGVIRTNLHPNPSVNNGGTNWGFYGGTTGGQSSEQAKYGTYSYKVVSSGSTPDFGGYGNTNGSTVAAGEPVYGSVYVWPEMVGAPVGTAKDYLRGVNVSGAEFGESATGLPGVHDTDYHYNTAATYTYLGSRGHSIARVPFRWERIQPTLGGALDAAELERLKDSVSAAGAAGMRVALDVHNYGRYIRADDVELVIGDGTLTTAHLSDLWTKLSAEFADDPNVWAYGLMNEPHDLPVPPPSFSPTLTPFDFESGTQGWSSEGTATVSQDTTVFHDGAASLKVTGSDVTLRANDSNNNTLVSTDGKTLSAWVMVPSGSTGTWAARLELQNSSYQWQNGTEVTLTPGTWTRIEYTPSDATWTGHKGIGVQFAVTGGSGTQSAYIDTVQQGTTTGNMTQAQAWEAVSSQVVSDIRATGDTKTILVPGYDWSGAARWAHAAPWVNDSNVIYEAHYYFDRDNSGDYPDTYAAEVTDAQSRGYADLVDRARKELKVFTDWLAANDVPGFLGEIGWPKNDTNWNTVGEALYDDLDAAGVGATYWATGEWYGTGYNLSAYETSGSAIDTANSQATVLEAHPSGTTIPANTAVDVRIGVEFKDSAGAKLSTVYGQPVTAYPDTWTRVGGYGGLAPANTSYVTVTCYTTATGPMKSNPATGTTLYFDGMLIEKAATMEGYFQGDFAPSGDFTYGWSGTANQSTSKLYAPLATSQKKSVSNPDYFHCWAPMGTDGRRYGRWRAMAGTPDATYRVARSEALSRTEILAGQKYTLLARMRATGWSSITAKTLITNGSMSEVVMDQVNITGVGSAWKDVRITFTALKDASVDSGIGLYVGLPTAPPATQHGYFDIAYWAVVPGEYTGDYFDGATPDTLQKGIFAWTGTPNASTSTNTLAELAGRSSIACSWRARKWMVI